MGDIATVDAAPQHLRALQQANRVRLARAELKRRIAAQEISVVEVIALCPWEAAGMEVSDVLMSQRRWGRARCRRLLVSLNIPENKHLDTFTQRQRTALCELLATRCPSKRRAAEPAHATRPAAPYEPEPVCEAEAGDERELHYEQRVYEMQPALAS